MAYQVQLRAGDELLEPGLPIHVRTYVSPLGPNGEDVLDAPKNGVAQLIHFESIKHRVRLGKRGPESWQEQQAVRQRAVQMLGTANKPLGPNCEHIASYVRDGKPESPQLARFAIVGLFAVALIAVSN